MQLSPAHTGKNSNISITTLPHGILSLKKSLGSWAGYAAHRSMNPTSGAGSSSVQCLNVDSDDTQRTANGALPDELP